MAYGWIKLHRKIMQNPIYFAERFSRAQAWIDLLMLANHAPNTIWIKGRPVKIDRGQLAWSVVSLAERWKWDWKTVKAFFLHMSSEGMLESVGTSQTTITTILNYGQYQDNGEQIPEQSPEQAPEHSPEHSPYKQEVKKGKKAKKYIHRGDALSLPVDIDTEAVREAWEGFREHRSSVLRKPMSSEAESMNIGRLLRFSSGDTDVAVEIIEQSIASNWTGIFPIKGNRHGNAGKSDSQKRAEFKHDEASLNRLREVAATVDRMRENGQRARSHQPEAADGQ